MSEQEDGETANVGTAPGPASTGSSSVFPCIEQPQRVTLHCNGYYLWGLRNGRVIARKKRSERDEFRLEYVNQGGDDNNNNIVQIVNHKFKSKLSAVLQEDGTRKVVCIKEKKEEKKEEEKSETTDNNDNDTTTIDAAKGQEQADTTSSEATDGDKNSSSADEANQKEATKTEEELLEEEEDETADAAAAASSSTSEEDSQWFFVKGEHGRTFLKSLATGDNLGLDSSTGKLVFCPLDHPTNDNISIAWDIECVTGELCFLSNPKLQGQVRCDMAGLLGLTEAWKGWEVFRLMEASHGYVKISSWMHSQWLICSMADGTVTTCSHAESFLEEQHSSPQGNDNDDDIQKKKCSKWAIEKSPKDAGVIIRSKTFGRLLSVKNGVLKTYDPNEEDTTKDDKTKGGKEEEEEEKEEWGYGNLPSQQQDDKNEDSTSKRQPGGTAAAAAAANNNSNWWNNSASSMRSNMNKWQQSWNNSSKSFNDSATAMGSSMRSNMNKWQASFNKSLSSSKEDDELPILKDPEKLAALAQQDTLVWQLEAAHLQTYYFVTTATGADSAAATTATNTDGDDDDKKEEDDKDITPKSIGPFPQVTPNLRQTEKIQLQRGATPANTKLYLVDKKQYIACSSNGEIVLLDHSGNESTNWIMEKRDTGSIFCSALHEQYHLSFAAEAETKDGDDDNKEAAKEDVEGKEGTSGHEQQQEKEEKATTPTKTDFSKFFGGKKEPLVKLVGVTTIIAEGDDADQQPTIWNLQPCMPRAVSSEKIKTFALGTGIAVGTTIAMPFALAGVGAVLGAVGAEVGFVANAIAVGLTGAEALASVGAIGATAYIVFRPEENSLTDDHQKDEEQAEAAWSKRPFSNWREW